jgi:hypothetical protein
MRSRTPLHTYFLLAVAVWLTWNAYGCAPETTGESLLTVRQSNASAMRAINDLAEARVITDPKIVDAAVAISTEITAATDDAQAMWLKGDTLGADFAVRRARSALDQLLKVQMQNEAKKKLTRPSP